MVGRGGGLLVRRLIIIVTVEPTQQPGSAGPRSALKQLVEQALSAVGVSWNRCHHDNLDDRVFVLLPPDTDATAVMRTLPAALLDVLHTMGTDGSGPLRPRLLLAAHSTDTTDPRSITGTEVATARGMLDATAVRRASLDSPGTLTMVLSQRVFDDTIRPATTPHPATFRPADVQIHGTTITAWIALPDHPYPHDPGSQSTSDIADAHTDHNEKQPGDSRPYGVNITGGVHGIGSGITIGGATGDHFTIGTPPPPTGEPDNPS